LSIKKKFGIFQVNVVLERTEEGKAMNENPRKKYFSQKKTSNLEVRVECVLMTMNSGNLADN
jgi:hypothetical protein